MRGRLGVDVMARVTVKDRGAKALLARVAKGAPGRAPKLRVGIFGDAAAQKHQDASISVGDIMAAHEFGLGVPERSWLRATVDAHAQDLQQALRKGAEAVAKGTHTQEQVLGLLGLRVVSYLQEAIRAGIPPGLDLHYLKRKLQKYPGATTPLIASAQSIGAIASAVVPAGED